MPQQAGIDSHAAATLADSIREARAALILRGGRIAAEIAVPIHLLFALTDWLLYHDPVTIAIRLLAALGIVLLLGLSYTQWGAKRVLGLVFVGLVITMIGLIGFFWRQHILLYDTQGGFILVLLTFCVLIPATTVQSTLVCAVLLAIYFGQALLRHGSATPLDFGVLAVTLGGTTAIGLVSRYIANTLWEREFRARQELQQALTELQTSQRQLVQAEKMAALGRLVAGVAHELNNSLAVITANLPPLERAAEILAQGTVEGKTDASEAARQTLARSIELLRRGAERAVTFTDNLRHYSTAPRGHYALTDLNAVVELSVSLVATKAREKEVTIHREYGTLAPVLCDAHSLSQVFVNVLDNACDAVAPSGNIWVRTEMILEGNSPVSPKEGGASSIVITIRDDGPGIPPEHLAKLFDPFFTTKPPGAGTGLGLGIARRIVEDHGGKIEVTNGSPGAVVSIILPATSSAISAQTEDLHPLEQPAVRNA